MNYLETKIKAINHILQTIDYELEKSNTMEKQQYLLQRKRINEEKLKELERQEYKNLIDFANYLIDTNRLKLNTFICTSELVNNYLVTKKLNK